MPALSTTTKEQHHGSLSSPVRHKECIKSPLLQEKQENQKEQQKRASRAILTLSPPAPLLEKETYRYPIQPQPFPELIFKISLIGKMDSLREIGDHDKGWRRCVDLSRIIELQPLTLVHRRFVMENCRCQEPVQS